MAPTRGDYLFTEVMTATPQKLQLMLIEAALRSAQQARQHWDQGREDGACQALIRSQNILVELFGAIDPQSADPMQQRVRATYLFVYRSLIAANLDRSPERLDDALRVLAVERDTWRALCDRLAVEGDPGTGLASFVA